MHVKKKKMRAVLENIVGHWRLGMLMESTERRVQTNCNNRVCFLSKKKALKCWKKYVRKKKIGHTRLFRMNWAYWRGQSKLIFGFKKIIYLKKKRKFDIAIFKVRESNFFFSFFIPTKMRMCFILDHLFWLEILTSIWVTFRHIQYNVLCILKYNFFYTLILIFEGFSGSIQTR